VHALAGKPERIALPPAPQGEAIGFDGHDQLVVTGEQLPAAVTVVPVPAAVAPAASSAAARGAAAGGGHAGVPTLTAVVIAAVTATLVVWIGGKFRRRRV
jgi:hypothetical protein